MLRLPSSFKLFISVHIHEMFPNVFSMSDGETDRSTDVRQNYGQTTNQREEREISLHNLHEPK